MKNNVNPKWELTELFLVESDIYHGFMGQLKNDSKNNVFYGKVKINDGEAVSMSKDKKVVEDNLDIICKMKLNFNLHKTPPKSKTFFGIEYNLN